MTANAFLRDLGLAALALAVLLAIPALFPSAALVDFIIYVAAYGLLAMSLNLLTGYTGLVSFGHAAYFAGGAYSFGLLMQSGAVSIPLAFVLSVGFTALMALAVGAICVRLKEIYFAFLTLAFQMMFHSIILTWVSLTGGDQGLMGGIPRPVFLGIDLSLSRNFYIFCMAVFMICVVILRQITQSPFGYTLRLIRDNPQRAEFLGVNVYRAKLISFVLAGSVASVGGILLALFASGAYPEFAYWTMSGQAIFMVMLGGSQVFLGPLLGAAILQGLNHYVTAFTEHHGLVLGVIIVAAVLGMRRGLADFVWDWRETRRERRAAEARASVAEIEAAAARAGAAQEGEA